MRFRLALFLVFSLTFFSEAQAQKPTVAAPQIGKPAPIFARKDLSGKARALAAFRGRPVALFFFCGCERCYALAKEWAAILPALKSVKGKAKPHTIIVYTEMTADSARTLAQSAGLDEKDALLLLDPDLIVALGIYRAEPCPRVFVVDALGILRYTNDHADDKAPDAPAALIVAKTVDALRK